MVPAQVLPARVPMGANALAQATDFRNQRVARQLSEIVVHMTLRGSVIAPRILGALSCVSMGVESTLDSAAGGLFEARYIAFLETIKHLRPSLHRNCSRMTGSVLDGEDVVQEALFQAYRKLDTFEDGRALEPWLFRNAHNQCIDFLRRRRVREDAEIEVLVEKIADLVDSTVGGVKAALNRGRSKLAKLPQVRAVSGGRVPENPEMTQLLNLYVQRFNQRDWDGLRELITADARVRVADRFVGRLSASPYFGHFERLTSPKRAAVGRVGGEQVIVTLRQTAQGWTPDAIVRVGRRNGHIERLVDYSHCPWVLTAAHPIAMTDAT